jgi:hypothetical protein
MRLVGFKLEYCCIAFFFYISKRAAERAWTLEKQIKRRPKQLQQCQNTRRERDESVDADRGVFEKPNGLPVGNKSFKSWWETHSHNFPLPGIGGQPIVRGACNCNQLQHHGFEHFAHVGRGGGDEGLG